MVTKSLIGHQKPRSYRIFLNKMPIKTGKLVCNKLFTLLSPLLPWGDRASGRRFIFVGSFEISPNRTILSYLLFNAVLLIKELATIWSPTFTSKAAEISAAVYSFFI